MACQCKILVILRLSVGKLLSICDQLGCTAANTAIDAYTVDWNPIYCYRYTNSIYDAGNNSTSCLLPSMYIHEVDLKESATDLSKTIKVVGDSPVKYLYDTIYAELDMP